MVVGTTLFKMDGTAFYSPSFPRGGLSATFSFEVTQLTSSGFGVTIQHKNHDDTSWTDVGSFSPVSSVGAVAQAFGSIKEQVRIKYEFSAGDAPTDGAHFIMSAPAWRPYS